MKLNIDITELTAAQIAWLSIKAHWLKSVLGANGLWYSLQKALNQSSDMSGLKIIRVALYKFFILLSVFFTLGIAIAFYDAILKVELNGPEKKNSRPNT